MSEEVRNVIIIGGGPAGYTAALYAARAGMKPLVFAGYEAGGQLMLTTEIENFPGFPQAIKGPDLMMRMRQQAERFGAEIQDFNVTSVDFSKRPFKITTDWGEYSAKTVIIATGASAKWLGLENEQRLIGRGVSSCATCDGAFFKNKHVAVIGGGDSAMEEALYLTNHASRVTIIHRRDKLRASQIMQQRAFDNEKIDFIWDTVVVDVIGEERLEAIKLKNVKTGEETTFKVDGMFVAIGHKPNTEIFKDWLEMDSVGYIIRKEFTMTNVPGVFVAGDVADARYRQAITAAGMGAQAAIDAERWLGEIEFEEEQATKASQA